MVSRRDVFRLTASIGAGEVLLDLYSVLSDWPPIPEIDETISEFDHDDKTARGTVLLPFIQGYGQVNQYQYCLMAHALRARGWTPIVLLCDGDLELCFRKENSADNAACVECSKYGRAWLSAFGLDFVTLSQVTVDVDPATVISEADEQTLTYQGINVSEFAESSARKFLKKYHVDTDDPGDRSVYRSFLRTAIRLVDRTERILDEYEVDSVLAENGAYVYGGIPMQVALNRDIPASSMAVGYTDGTIIVGNHKHRMPHFTDPGDVEEVLSQQLSDRQERLIDETMAGREDGSDVRVKWSGDSSARLCAADGRTTVSMFTNLMWDASLEVEHHSAFADPYDWVDQTISALADRDDAILVIKTHPAEAVRGTNEGMASWIRDNVGSLPENVELLDPDTEVSPYELIDETDVALVWNSTIGLEMAYNGVATVVSGVAHYREFGFTFDANNQTEYEAFISDLEFEMTAEMRARARRYAYLLFVMKQIDFPFYRHEDGKAQLLPVQHEQLTEGNENIDAIISAIVNDESALVDPLEGGRTNE